MTTNDDSISDLTNLCYIEWPNACLTTTEDLFLTICCGNTTVQWAMHRARSNYDVITYWKSPQITDDDQLFIDSEFVELLDLSLNKEARSYIFGSDLPSKQAAEKEAIKRGFQLTVYLMGSDSHQVTILSRIISAIPCRIFLFQRKDFFLEEQGMYATMGMDRLATLRGAAAFCGFPALVIDGGACLKYTAADGRGNVIGGGISPGISTRLKSIISDAPALPDITINELKKRMNRAIFSNLPIPLFARDTKDAIIVSVLSELWHSLDHTIQIWLQRMNVSTTSTISRTIFITGESGEILRELLGVNRDKIIDVLKNESCNRVPFQIDLQPCLVHKGMASIIAKESEKARNNPKKTSKVLKSLRSPSETAISEFALSFLKKKVAKKYKGIDLIGTVAKITQENNNYLFHIRYESGYPETVDLLNLKNLMDNFQVYEASTHIANKKTRSVSTVSENSERTSKVRKSPGKESTNSTKRINEGHESKIASDRIVVVNPTLSRSEVQTPDSLRSKPGRKRKRNESIDDDASKAKMDAMAKKAQALLDRPRDLINLRVMKYFIDEDTNTCRPFFGTIDDYEAVIEGSEKEKLWHITYDDGDKEHCNKDELLVILKQYKKHRKDDPKPRAARF